MVDVLRDVSVPKDKLSMKMVNVETLCLVQVGTVICICKFCKIKKNSTNRAVKFKAFTKTSFYVTVVSADNSNYISPLSYRFVKVK